MASKNRTCRNPTTEILCPIFFSGKLRSLGGTRDLWIQLCQVCPGRDNHVAGSNGGVHCLFSRMFGFFSEKIGNEKHAFSATKTDWHGNKGVSIPDAACPRFLTHLAFMFQTFSKKNGEKVGEKSEAFQLEASGVVGLLESLIGDTQRQMSAVKSWAFNSDTVDGRNPKATTWDV